MIKENVQERVRDVLLVDREQHIVTEQRSIVTSDILEQTRANRIKAGWDKAFVISSVPKPAL